MHETMNSVMNLVAGLRDLIDTVVAIFHGFGELFRAMRAILRLIGSLLGA